MFVIQNMGRTPTVLHNDGGYYVLGEAQTAIPVLYPTERGAKIAISRLGLRGTVMVRQAALRLTNLTTAQQQQRRSDKDG